MRSSTRETKTNCIRHYWEHPWGGAAVRCKLCGEERCEVDCVSPRCPYALAPVLRRERDRSLLDAIGIVAKYKHHVDSIASGDVQRFAVSILADIVVDIEQLRILNEEGTSAEP